MEYGLVAVWLTAYALLAVLGYPVAARLFPRFATRGVGLALPVALAVLGVSAYWVGRITFGPITLAIGLLLLGVLAVLAAFDRDALLDRRLDPAVTVDRTIAAETTAVFAVAFCFMVAVRAHDPGIIPGGGEKFLDYGLLRSLLRGSTLPPQDMWFAGQSVRYYYGGHMLSALLTLLTGTAPRFAYNLALAGFYAMLVTAVYDLAGSIAAERGYGRRKGGLFSAFFVGFASNLFTPLRTAALSLPPAGVVRTLAGFMAARTRYSTEEILAKTDFSYWTASRVIPGTINEFPLFAWLNGDLHAHMTGTPFLVLAAALAFSYYRTPREQIWRRRTLVFGATPILAGLQAVVNTWSFPTVFGLMWLAVALADAPPWTLLPTPFRTRIAGVVNGSDNPPNDDPGAATGDGDSLRAELARPTVAAVSLGAATALGVLVVAPFFLGSVGGRSIALVEASARSSLGGLLIVHGGFVLPFLAYLGLSIGIDRPAPVVTALVLLGGVTVVNGLPVLALTVPLLVGGWLALRFDRAVGFEAALIIGGVGLVTLVEFLYLKELAGPGRFNTVFKVYAQVWVIWSLAVGPALAGLLDPAASAEVPTSTRTEDGVPAPDGGSDPDSESTESSLPASDVGADLVVSLAIAVLVVSLSVYGGLALSDHFAREYPTDPTLDGTDYVDQFHPSQAPAIEWLDEREGQPVLLSAPATGRYPGGSPERGNAPGMYNFGASPAASLTGLPTVVGWHHEVGYRGPEAYFSRVRDVDAAYTSRSAAVRMLNKYDVRYVWVGPAERARYGDNLTAFEQIPGVEAVVQTPTVTVYEVRHDELPAETGNTTTGNGG